MKKSLLISSNNGLIYPKKSCSLPSSTDANVGAANGLADLQEFHGIDPSELANGQITNYITGTKYVSKSKLTSNEVLKIGNHNI